MSERWPVAAVSSGLVFISIALGLLHMNEMRVARAAMELGVMHGQVSADSAEVTAALDVYTDLTLWLPALICGTLGVGALGGGLVMVVFRVVTLWRGGRPA